MTGYERMINILNHKPVDRIAVYEHFWGDTHKTWVENGWVKQTDNFDDLFEYDMSECWAFNTVADLDFVPQVVEENEHTIVTVDGNGAKLRTHKYHDTTPEHIGYLVEDRDGWEEHIKPLLKPDLRRINIKGYKDAMERAHKAGRYFVLSGVNVFEMIHPMCGHVNMLMGMVEDPDWIRDMVDTYAQLQIDLQEELFSIAGKPDGIWYYEDMGYKGSPFMSPAMYKELIQPGHIRTIDFAHSQNMKVIMHSCGFVEPLLPYMIEAGIDMLQVIEVKAGMDLLRIHKNYGDKIGFMGGIDVRALYSNDKEIVNRELEAKIPTVKQGFCYALHSDHSIPKTVNVDTYRHFIEYGKELGTY